MRLLKLGARGELSSEDFVDDEIPPYAILSHTWGADKDEMTFGDVENQNYKSKIGHAKIQFCGEQARKDLLEHFWVDTCCINRADLSELSEAIISMFRWYRGAVKCYVYLSDVSARKRDKAGETLGSWQSAFRNSRWFTRGWTLQELLAPKSVEFYSRDGVYLGDRNTLEQEIHEITGIPIPALRGAPLSGFSIDDRLRWAENRDTKKKEDKAYCLLGIFGVYISLLYGEGDNAYIRLKEEINKASKILDKLPYARGAMFNSYDQDQTTCHPATRVDVLSQIYDWSQAPRGKSIFWLCGMAGTGKSTISSTFAEWLIGQAPHGVVDLGGSFFFKRGEGDRGSASRFFSTIVRSLVLKVPGLDRLIAEVIGSDPTIFDKALGEQFDKLIFQPLQKVKTTAGSPTLVVVVDALDECEKEREIKVILDLWSRLPQITNVRLKLFLTSRPELPIRLGFKKMSDDMYQDMLLQDAVPPATIKHDIAILLKDELTKIREDYNNHQPSVLALSHDWPGEQNIESLAVMASPLFIVAATMCRFIGDLRLNPRTRLASLLKMRGIGSRSQMEQTYLPVLQQIMTNSNDSYDVELLCQDFRRIVGSIVILGEPLSILSLAELLGFPQDDIWSHLSMLHSVLHVPADFDTPVRPLHLSFSEFLLSGKLQQEPFGVDGPATHGMLAKTCLELLSRPDGLRENMCELEYPGQPRQEANPATLDKYLTHTLQYACQYWVHHLQHSKTMIHDGDEVHLFLQRHLLHWLEALSLMNRIVEVVGFIGVLQSLTSANGSAKLSAFLEDARRVILASRYIINIAPLQVHSSAMVFTPQTSIVRNKCGRIPAWIQNYPVTPSIWSAELQKLEGHTGTVRSVGFSHDGSLVASGASDKTVRLWNPSTGQELQTLEQHGGSVNAVAFSPDDVFLASASSDKTVILWNLNTGQEVRTLKGHTSAVNTVAFSRDGLLLATGASDNTIKIWNVSTGHEAQMLQGHTGSVYAVAFAPHNAQLVSSSSDMTLRLWNVDTGREIYKLDGHAGPVSTVAFSEDGSLVASGSSDQVIKLWNPRSGRAVKTLEGHSDAVRAVAFSQSGDVLASGASDNIIRLWDPSTGHELHRLEGHTSSISTVAFSRDGLLLASGSFDSTVRLWKLGAGQRAQMQDGHSSSVYAMAFSPDGSLLASGASGLSDRAIKIWNPNTGQAVRTLEGHVGQVRALRFSQDGSHLASGSFDETIKLWNLTTGRDEQTLRGHTGPVNTLAYSQNERLLASGSFDDTVKVWDLSNGQAIHTLKGHIDSVYALAFSQDSSLLASGSFDTTVKLWNLSTGKQERSLGGHSRSVNALAFSRDGSLLASGSSDMTIRLWTPSTGQEVRVLQDTPEITAISFSSDGKTLLTNRGVMGIGESNDLSSEAPGPHNIVMRKDWVQRGNQNYLWLPQEYRSDCSAFRDNTLAIGRYSGQVIFIQFDTS